MVDKPQVLRRFDDISALVGRPMALWALAVFFRWSARLSGKDKSWRRVLERILGHSGQEQGPRTVSRILRSSQGIYAQHMSTIASFDPGRIEEILAPAELVLAPRVEKLRGRGQGVILAGPHFGNQALAFLAIPRLGVPLSVVFIHAEPYRWLERPGLRFLELGEAAIECVAALGRNELVFLAADMDFFPGERVALFFGAPARPPHGPARLALATGAPILPIYPVRSGARWRIEAGEALLPEGRAQEELERALFGSMEAFIQEYPDHWWAYEDIWDLRGMDSRNREMFSRFSKLRRG